MDEVALNCYLQDISFANQDICYPVNVFSFGRYVNNMILGKILLFAMGDFPDIPCQSIK